MALKDWKRIYPKKIKVSGVIFERKEDDNDEVHIFPITKFPSPKHWRVVIQENRNLIDMQDFKTKSQALKYAKSYMRTH